MDGPSRRPSERCRSEGSRAQRDPDAGVCFFCLLCFAQAKKSEAPGGAQQKRPVNLDNQPGKMQIKHQRITNPSRRNTRQPLSALLCAFLCGKDQASRSAFRYNGAIQPTWSRCN